MTEINLSILLGSGEMPDTEDDSILSSIPRRVATTPTPDDKATKAEVNYRPAHADHPDRGKKPTRRGTRFDMGILPVGGSSTEGNTTTKRAVTAHPRECGTCSHYGLSTCSIVSGTIDPEMLCDLWRGAE